MIIVNNCLFSPTSENPSGFLFSIILAKFKTKPLIYLLSRLFSFIKKDNYGVQ